jgi:hypothetical protein
VKLRTLTLAAFLPLVGLAASVSIQLDSGAFKVAGITSSAEPVAGWDSVFSVYAGKAADVPAMAGTYSVESGALVFRPRFPLASGVQYRAVFRGAELVEALFDGPKPASGPAARVDHAYPSADLLPANELKFYLSFSAPMQRGGVWSYIHLVGEDGKTIELPFLEIDQELWDRENRRLTVLFDPGRIKRGVTPQEEIGAALVEGKRYTLVVDRDLRDARGLPLAETFRKEFRVGPAIREGIDLKKWKLSATPAAVTIDFDRPLDYALLQHVFEVKGVSGTGTVEREETRWRFVPSQPLKPGRYELVIDMTLEDLAGNRIGRPFDVDLFDRVTERITKDTTTLPFEVR